MLLSTIHVFPQECLLFVIFLFQFYSKLIIFSKVHKLTLYFNTPYIFNTPLLTRLRNNKLLEKTKLPEIYLVKSARKSIPMVICKVKFKILHQSNILVLMFFTDQI